MFTYKVSRCYSVTLFNWTPIFDWCVVRSQSRTKHYKDMSLVHKEIGLSHQMLLTTPHSIVNIVERTHEFGEGINKHALPLTITKSEEIQILIWFLLMLHHRFANASQI